MSMVILIFDFVVSTLLTLMNQLLIVFISLLSAVRPPDAYIAASGRGDIVNPQKMSTDTSP